MKGHILAIDQGTTSSRAIVFTKAGKNVGVAQQEFKQYYPQNAWVEHDPEQIWATTLQCCQEAILKAGLTPQDIAAIGISNQRETTIVWDKATGKAVYPAIVWQDRRTAEACQKLSVRSGVNRQIKHKTGLLLDSYFSATKIAWILDNVEGARKRAENGELLFGTVDCYLLWRVTGGKTHATDASNASRTMLFIIRESCWDDDLLSLFKIPRAMLPTVVDNAGELGVIDAKLLGAAIPVCGMAGDQQAATVGQACFEKGMIKSTYGTGCFVLLNTGEKVVFSKNRLLSTIAYQINGKVTYGLEGSIFIAGAAIQWLRDGLKLFQSSSETEALARSIDSNEGVYMVPAFTGLGAPYWDPHARGAISGLTRDTGIAHIVRAALEAVCYQTQDLMQAMTADYKSELATLRVDGGMVANDWLLQFLSDILHLDVQRPACIETSALGAAFLAGLGVGLYGSLDEVAKIWSEQQTFTPVMSVDARENLCQGWKRAVNNVRDD